MEPGLDDRELLLRALPEAADQLSLGIAVLQLSEPERVAYINDGAAQIFGRTRAEIEGGSLVDVIAPEVYPRERARLQDRARGNASPGSFETLGIRPDGTRVPIEVSATRVVTTSATYTVTFIRDITARQHTIETLRRSEERFRRVVEAAPDGVLIVRRGKIEFMNELAATLLGLANTSEGLGTSVADHLAPEEAAIATERISQMLATGASFEPISYRPRRAPERALEIKSIVIDRDREPAVLSFARDVTSRKRIEQELVRADRLASIGMMSAAVAHEINNPLAYSRLCLQFLERELPTLLPPDARPRILEQLGNASHGIERVATIVRDLRTFARADEGEVGPIDVVACVEQAIKLVANELRHRATLVRDILGTPKAHGSASRMEQVVVNLLINAAHAISPGDPANNEVGVTVREDAGTVTIAVRDTGAGIPPALRERVFEPFFTTKEIGVGTGLGLAVCRSIVEQQGGSIGIDATATRGTTMIVKLPVHRGTARGPTAMPEGARARRRLVILVVDDEPLVRRALATVLGREHEVLLAEHGRHAIEQLATRPVDVVVCDVMMPVMSGSDLYEHLCTHDPALARRFVFITGGTLGAQSSFLDNIDVPILYKPFELAKVLALVTAAAER
ncbi:MAG TPA: PAS domain S-box protein [Kofleriaceae bacterium]|nr:PAS domain S-box protein [Kofleriaceae bacterium]